MDPKSLFSLSDHLEVLSRFQPKHSVPHSRAHQPQPHQIAGFCGCPAVEGARVFEGGGLRFRKRAN